MSSYGRPPPPAPPPRRRYPPGPSGLHHELEHSAGPFSRPLIPHGVKVNGWVPSGGGSRPADSMYEWDERGEEMEMERARESEREIEFLMHKQQQQHHDALQRASAASVICTAAHVSRVVQRVYPTAATATTAATDLPIGRNTARLAGTSACAAGSHGFTSAAAASAGPVRASADPAYAHAHDTGPGDDVPAEGPSDAPTPREPQRETDGRRTRPRRAAAAPPPHRHTSTATTAAGAAAAALGTTTTVTATAAGARIGIGPFYAPGVAFCAPRPRTSPPAAPATPSAITTAGAGAEPTTHAAASAGICGATSECAGRRGGRRVSDGVLRDWVDGWMELGVGSCWGRQEHIFVFVVVVFMTGQSIYSSRLLLQSPPFFFPFSCMLIISLQIMVLSYSGRGDEVRRFVCARARVVKRS
ncbi:hypothetical protein BJV78DRAFT_266562 [Lactifluus subvellereus]|nr:hypothetical protein BJV78DRAFT_266562 [Lactifluus subvellereus]